MRTSSTPLARRSSTSSAAACTRSGATELMGLPPRGVGGGGAHDSARVGRPAGGRRAGARNQVERPAKGPVRVLARPRGGGAGDPGCERGVGEEAEVGLGEAAGGEGREVDAGEEVAYGAGGALARRSERFGDALERVGAGGAVVLHRLGEDQSHRQPVRQSVAG